MIRVPIAKEGAPFIGICLLLTTIATVVQIVRPSPVSVYTCLIFLVLSIFVILFFRDPERATPSDENIIVAAADGKVIDIRELEEPQYLKGPAKRISIFMSPFNAHINRYPVSGQIEYLNYNPGKFFSAFKEKASSDNENLSTGIDTGKHKVLIKQIAGLIARRIVNYSKEGQRVVKGARMGMIRFGSRAEVYVHPNVTIKVKTGDKVYAGKSIIGEL